jgi:sulfopyruvate decarboxylase TPP-binding subunit
MPAKIVARDSAIDPARLRERSERVVRALVELGVTHAVGVPDNATRFLYEWLAAEPRIQTVPVCREGEAWAIASGLWIGGKVSVVIIQNTGFLESGDALRGTAIEMGVPLVALIDYRGYHTLSHDQQDTVDSAASLFEPTLRAWNVSYHFLKDGRESDDLRAAFAQAHESSQPVALLLI